jgi:hypothetical protein
MVAAAINAKMAAVSLPWHQWRERERGKRRGNGHGVEVAWRPRARSLGALGSAGDAGLGAGRGDLASGGVGREGKRGAPAGPWPVGPATEGRGGSP